MVNIEFTEEQKRQQFEAAVKAKPLKDQLPSLRTIEGFPIGTDEDILALSDPPYYTACPNPYINDYIEAFGKPYDPATDDYERTPFLGDVSEGKNDPIYMAHTYHTKVPYKAISRFIQHYSREGDIVFDGFCGTGMTAIAAQKINRKTILCDLSPIACFIASRYNEKLNLNEFENEAKKIISEVESDCHWMYSTLHTDGRSKGVINYVLWSEVLICPFCKNEFSFWEASVNHEVREVRSEFECPNCKSSLKKDSCNKATETIFDSVLNEKIARNKQIPVLINYIHNDRRYEKSPDQQDLKLIEKIEDLQIPQWFPVFKLMNIGERWGDMWRAGGHFGITHVHHFFYKRSLWVLSELLERSNKSRFKKEFLFLLTSFMVKTGSKLHNVGCKDGNINLAGAAPNSMFIPSLIAERNLFILARGKLNDISPIFSQNNDDHYPIISTSSSTNLNIKSNSVDYIFVDPPFGHNLMYSELNFIWESWIKIFTNINSEAIMNKSQHKELADYKEIISQSFNEFYRILKPNRWITVEFHNSQASVWNAIQDSLSKAGFIIAQVAVLDKKQGTFKQMVAPGTVKNDLIINAYKPRHQFVESFLKKSGAGMEIEFIIEHLSHLPKEPSIERTAQMLFSKMLAHYIQHGYEIRFNARQFYNLLREHLKLIDGYWFLDNEISKYDEWKRANGLHAIEAIAKGQQTLFVTDERSFLIWLYNYVSTPKTYSEIFTASRNILSSTSMIEDQIPEPKQLLDTNFIFQDGKYRRPTTESEREGIESKRERELQKAFEKILEQAQTGTKKIRNVRKEAIAYGFTKCYQEGRFAEIIAVAKKLHKEILANNSEINDFVEIAHLKVGKDI